MACVYLVPLVSQVSPLQGLADGSTRHRAGATLGKAVAAVKPPRGGAAPAVPQAGARLRQVPRIRRLRQVSGRASSAFVPAAGADASSLLCFCLLGREGGLALFC